MSSAWEQMPDEIWLLILGHLNSSELSRVMLVSRHLNRVASDHRLWRDVDLSPLRACIDDASLVTLTLTRFSSVPVRCGVSVWSVNEMDSLDNSDEECSSEDEEVQDSANCSFSQLSITRRRVAHKNKTESDGVDTLTQLRRQVSREQSLSCLHSINLAKCSNLTDQGLLVLTQVAGRMLRHLDLSQCSKLTDSTAVSIGQSCPNLQSLYAEWLHSWTDVGILSIAKGCTQLTQCSFMWCELLTDAAASALSNCATLQVVNMSLCTRITDSGAVSLLQNCIHLEKLYLFMCENLTDATIDAAKQASRQRKLRYLNLKLCYAISDDAIESLKLTFPNCQFIV